MDTFDNDYAITHYDFDNLINQVEEEDEEDCDLPEELARLLKQEERAIQPHEESIEVVNWGNEYANREVEIWVTL